MISEFNKMKPKEDLCHPWCVSKSETNPQPCPSGYDQSDYESSNKSDNCFGKCAGDEMESDDDKQIRTVRDALMMYHELDLTLNPNKN